MTLKPSDLKPSRRKEKSDAYQELVSRKVPALTRALELPVRIAFCFADLRIGRKVFA